MCASKRYLTDFLPGLLYSILSVLGIIPIIVPTLAAQPGFCSDGPCTAGPFLLAVDGTFAEI
jgi:hypothetical protein